MKKYTLELIVFISGAVVMIMEMVGSRILAPYVGTSVLVWTSLIGIILGSLSLGYFWGGKLADSNATYRKFGLIIFASALMIAITTIIKNPILDLIGTSIRDIRTSSIILTIVLFSPPSITLGMISPYAIKLKLKSLDSTGQTVGNLYAISTIGSIAGTFLAGFVLITFLGSTKILIGLSATLCLMAIFAITKKNFKARATLSILVALISITTISQTTANSEGIIEVDTLYNHVRIYDTIYKDKEIKMFQMGNSFHSAMSLNDDDLVFEYTKYYRLIDHFAPKVKSTLLIGGGAYSYPKDFLSSHKNATMDVVEIDPQLTQLAKKYFELEENENLTIYHEDGRIFLNNNEKKYDAIFIDAFLASLAIPHHLTTIESVEHIYNSLNEDGIVLANIISSITGDKGQFLRAEYRTYKEIFPQVYVIPVQFPEHGEANQNIILIASKSEKNLKFKSKDDTLNEYLSHVWKEKIPSDMPILTDEFAPVDQYTLNLL